VPPSPRLRRALRDAASDFYFNSWRFLGANFVMGALLLLILFGAVATPWALLLVALLVPPAAGTMRMATRLIRDGHADLGDFGEAIRRPWPVFALGLIQLAVIGVLVVDVVVAGSWQAWVGTFLAASAAYGLFVVWAFAIVAWPLLLDPVRDAEPVRSRLRLAIVVLLAHPVRLGLFALGVAGFLLVAGILIAPIITFAVGLAWLAIARYVLPIADRVEGRETLVLDDFAG